LGRRRVLFRRQSRRKGEGLSLPTLSRQSLKPRVEEKSHDPSTKARRIAGEARKKLKDVLYKNGLYDALAELSSVEFFISEALRNLEFAVERKDSHRLLGDFIGAMVNAYYHCGAMMQSVRNSTVSEDVKDTVERYISELRDELWNIVREYLAKLKEKEEVEHG